MGCMEGYLDALISESLPPKCTRPGCESIYMLRDLTPQLLPKYQECCFRHLSWTHPAQPNPAEQIQVIVNRIREERKINLRREVPLAVATVAEIVFKKRLEAVTPPKPAGSSVRKRLCMNTYCEGSLDENLFCQQCHTQFCRDCEEPQRTNHVCNPDQKASIDAKKEFPTCPNCGQTTDKDNGCDMVRCNICGTSFYYRTDRMFGQNVAQGRQAVDFHLTTSTKLSVTYRTHLTQDQMEVLLRIETAIDRMTIPKQDTYTKLISPEQKPQLARKYNEYHYKKYLKQRAMGVMAQVEERIRHHNFTTEDLALWLRTILVNPS